MRKLRIMYISHERKMGGANLCLLELAKEMKKRGHEVYVTVLLKNCPLAVELKKCNIATIPAFFGWWQMPKKWNLFLKTAFRFLYALEWIQLLRLSCIAKKLKIDIIHSNSSCIDLGMKLSIRTRIPHIWHFREFGDTDYDLEYLEGREKSIAYINQNAKNIIFISKTLKKYYNDIKSEKNRRIIYDGVSEDYLLMKGDKGETPVIFLMAANINKNKNQKIILEAAAILKQKGITEFKVLMAGAATALSESQKYEKELYIYQKDYGLEMVEFLGYVKDMNQIRKIADVEIVPSVREAFGRVTVEAMLAGNPVVASDSGASVELIEEGKTGFLFQQGDRDALAARMEFCIKNPKILKEMGKTARKTAKEKYLIKKNADEVEKLYLSICGE